MDLSLVSRVVLLAPHLNPAAEGHFASWPKAMKEAFEAAGLLVEVWGQNVTFGTSTWYSPLLPASIASPTPSASFRFALELLAKCKKSEPTAYVLYEGNLPLITLISALLFFDTRSGAVVNIFSASKWVDALRGGLRLELSRRYLRFLEKRLAGRLRITFDTARFAAAFDRGGIVAHGEFPSFSANFRELNAISEVNYLREKVQVVLRGEEFDNILIKVLSRRDPRVPLHFHGATRELKNQLANHENVTFNDSLDEEHAYISRYKHLKSNVFLYPSHIWAYQSSGRILDCVAARVPFVVMPETTLADTGEKYGGYAIVDIHSEQSILDALDGKLTTESKWNSERRPSPENSASSILAMLAGDVKQQVRLPTKAFALVFIGFLRSRWFLYHTWNRVLTRVR